MAARVLQAQQRPADLEEAAQDCPPLSAEPPVEVAEHLAKEMLEETEQDLPPAYEVQVEAAVPARWAA